MGRLNTKVIILLQLFECKKIIYSLNHPQTSLCSRTLFWRGKTCWTFKQGKLFNCNKVQIEMRRKQAWSDQTRSHQTNSRLKISNCVITLKRLFDVFDVTRRFSTRQERLTTLLERFNDIFASYWSWKNEAVRVKQTVGSVVSKRAGRLWAFEGQEEKARDRQGGLPHDQVPIESQKKHIIVRYNYYLLTYRIVYNF